jgi:hypothetical protein
MNSPRRGQQYIRSLEQDFEDAEDWGVQPTLMLICVYANQYTIGPTLLVPVLVFPDAWISDGQLPADALERIDPDGLRTAGATTEPARRTPVPEAKASSS